MKKEAADQPLGFSTAPFRMTKSFDDSLRMERFKMRIVGLKETSP